MPKKIYNGIAYDTDADYSDLIEAAAGRGDNRAAALYEQQRNAKIAGEGMALPLTSRYAAYLPGVTTTGVDFSDQVAGAARAGDFPGAARYEQQRNAKIREQGLQYPETHQFDAYLPENRYRFDPEQDADYTEANAAADRAYQALTQMGAFQYDAENDPVYQAYAERYLRVGRSAMEDTLGRASALTGGYGSTYAESAAQQAYAGYLERLNDVLPELYSAAYRRYRDARSDKEQDYSAARSAADKAYARAYERWSAQLGYARADEENTRKRVAAEDQAASAAAQEAEKAARSESAAAEKAVQARKSDLGAMILKTGYTPTDAELAAAGMTRDEAEAWKQAYLTGRR